MKIILASKSPRRRELMQLLPFEFDVLDSCSEEIIDPTLTPEQVAQSIAEQKAQAVFKQQEDAFVIGADTIVVLDKEILGKPCDESDAFSMLKKLSGRTHEVVTGVCLMMKDKTARFSAISKVTFYSLTDEEILSYVKTLEPMDKAGAYGIQGKAALFVEKIEGDYFNIVGLPVSLLYRKIKEILPDKNAFWG